MVIKRVGPVSCAKLLGVLYAVVGAVLGACVSLVALVSAGAGLAQGHEGAAVGALFGVGAILVFPLLYGGLGYVMTLVLAWLYNIVAGWVGGIEVELE